LQPLPARRFAVPAKVSMESAELEVSPAVGSFRDSAMQSFAPVNTLAAVKKAAVESMAWLYQNLQCSVVARLEQCFWEGLLLMQMTSQRLWRSDPANRDSSVSLSSLLSLRMSL
jgi:hypothetical protein